MFLCPDRSKSLIDSNAQFIPLTFSVKGIELHLLNKIEQSFLTVLRKRERKREHLQVLYILAYINNVLLCDPPVTTLLTEREKKTSKKLAAQHVSTDGGCFSQIDTHILPALLKNYRKFRNMLLKEQTKNQQFRKVTLRKKFQNFQKRYFNFF